MEFTYPGAGSWINSCLVGANSYKLLSSEEAYQASFLEERTDDWPRSGMELRYAEVTGNWDRQKLWMVLYPSQEGSVSVFADVIEKVLVAGLYQNGFFWPFDLVKLGNMAGHIIRPVDTVRYRPVRCYLGNTQAERWSIAISAFQRILALHGQGLALNGFAREQIRVDIETNQVYIWPGDTTSSVARLTSYACRSDYLSIPLNAEKSILKHWDSVSGVFRDVFSCAVLAFYLLFFTHPFIGSAYWPLMKEDYWVQYMNYPEYIFDPSGSNQLGYLDFEQEIQTLWGKTDPALRGMFDTLFLAATHPGDVRSEDMQRALDIPQWIRLLEQDAAVNGIPEKRTQFPFEMMNNYQV